MRIAVIGGGLFGCTAAVHLARAGLEVHLYEQSGHLLSVASTINQCRLHSGYHYPRSPQTIRECQEGLASFREEYGEAIIDGGEQYYAIALAGSKVSGPDYLKVLLANGLPFERHTPGFLNRGALETVIKVREARIDPERLKYAVAKKISDVVIRVHLTPAPKDLREEFDKIIVAAYASTNEVMCDLGCPLVPLQYELCEKPVIRLPDTMRKVSAVVMDGPFCSIDPWGDSGYHVMGHVRHAIHSAHVAMDARMPEHLEQYLNCGLVEDKTHSAFEKFREAGKVFIPALADAEHIGSMWTVRAVLPNRDHDDARPTLVSQIDDQVIRVFSGKLGCAVTAAQNIVSSLDKTDVSVQSAA